VTTELPGQEQKDGALVGNKWILPTDMNIVSRAEEEFGKRLVATGWTNDEINWLRVAFREALINAIVHGNLSIKDKLETQDWAEAADAVLNAQPTGKKVFVKLDISPYRIEVVVRDEGKGFDYTKVADPTEGTAVLESSGRGMLFMKTFFDSITYNGVGNEVTMVKIKSD